MTKILVLSPAYLRYEDLVCNAFRSKGYDVAWFENTSVIRDRVDCAPPAYQATIKLVKRLYRFMTGERRWFLLFFLDPLAIFHSWFGALKLLRKIPRDATLAIVIRGDMQPIWFYRSLRRRVPGIELVNFQYDDLSRVCRTPAFWRRAFDRVYTYSYVDAVEERFTYAPMPFLEEKASLRMIGTSMSSSSVRSI